MASVPHAGLEVPPEAQPYCVLDHDAIVKDGDEQAREIYAIEDEVELFVTSDVARAVVDLNRPPDDRRVDGVVKTHTCWMVPVYDPFLPDDVAERLLARYHAPYHRRLSELAGQVPVGVDLHTMAARAPPVAPVPGKARPGVCLSDASGTIPEEWMLRLVEAFDASFPDVSVQVNEPFQGGYIIRHHGTEMPWVQVELSRAPFCSVKEKRRRVLEALTHWCEAIGVT
ncbi:MAG: N-formylglutamate amidohydrolase [Euryarchaeota archaeon]|nr:N-formylglutamate amidohydrolase [Euryarchaeota archaeon]